MKEGEDLGPNYEVDENILLNFEEFCDMKYQDPLVQNRGYFKIHLQKDVKRKTTLEDFFKYFSMEAYRAVKEIVFIQNPVNNGLYGHHTLPATNTFREKFMESVAPESFQIHEEQLNCCMESLENEEPDALIRHFFSQSVSTAVTLSDKRCKKQSMGSIVSNIPVWRASFEKRQLFNKQRTIEEKSRALKLSMLSEKFKDSNQKQCKCNACAYMNIEIPLHPSEPIGSLYSSGIDESYEKHVSLTENFSMVDLCYKNMLSMLDSAFNGVSFPALYLGTTHSVFPIHVEDLSLWSFNFLLFGFPKLWIIIPPHSVAKLTDALTRCGFGGHHQTCRNSLGHKFFIPDIQWLVSEEIPYSVVIQRQGEGVVLLPNAAHFGFNLGPNLAEACNLGTEAWIPYGCVYPICLCFGNAVHADLTPLVAVHKRSLLKPYIKNDIMNAVEDKYFQRSVVLPKRSVAVESTGQLVKQDTSKLKCPVCPYTWGPNIPRKNVETHMGKYHSQRKDEECVVKFFNEKFSRKKAHIST